MDAYLTGKRPAPQAAPAQHTASPIAPDESPRALLSPAALAEAPSVSTPLLTGSISISININRAMRYAYALCAMRYDYDWLWHADRE